LRHTPQPQAHKQTAPSRLKAVSSKSNTL
jgi:hypothetical protein